MNALKTHLEKIIADLKTEFAAIRTGRATPALVENLAVDAYGTAQPLKALAAISAPEARQIVIQPWDKTVIAAIEKAIASSSLGLAPIVDKDTIRLSLPALTAERKRDLAKVIGEKLEQARIQVRQARDHAMKEIEAAAKETPISEDEKFRKRQEIEKTVSEANTKIEDSGKRKETEVMAG